MGPTKPRYEVVIFGRLTLTANYGSLDIVQPFTDKARAERFARAISHYLPQPGQGEMLLAWVMVYTLAVSERDALSGHGPKLCYRSFDPGGVEAKHRSIPPGYYGAARITEVSHV